MDRYKGIGLEIIGPKQMGILDQYMTLGWKWHSPLGMFGSARQISYTLLESCLDPQGMVKVILGKDLEWARKWNRRWTSDSSHLWIAAWRLQTKVKDLEIRLANRELTEKLYFIDSRKCTRFQRWLLEVFFGFTFIPEPKPYDPFEEDDDD